MKKFFLILIAIIYFVSSINAQNEVKKEEQLDKDRKHTVYADFYPLYMGIIHAGGGGLGLGYDYNINKYFELVF